MNDRPGPEADNAAEAAHSVSVLAERIASIPAALERTSSVPLPSLDHVPQTVVTTGIGASEGPARLLACTLSDAGVAARFVPLMRFAIELPRADLLVVFSQNLSPNARLALAANHRFRMRWLVTSAGYVPGVSTREAFVDTYRAQGVVPIQVPPASEDGMLLRVVGSSVASWMAVRIAAHLAPETRAKVEIAATDALYSVVPMEPLSSDPVALVAAGVSVESMHAHRWKILEALLRDDPPVWDVLQVAHGPLQAIHERPLTLLVLSTPRAKPLVTRLQAALSLTHHRVVVVEAPRDDVLAYFAHAAAIDACVLATLRAYPRNLFRWPGRGGDAPLYDLGS